MRSENPDEFWERMRNRGSIAPPSERSADVVAQPPIAEQAVRPTPERDRDAPAPSEGPPAPSEARHPSGGSQSESDEPSAAELVKQLTEQTKTLVTQELELAKAQMTEKGKKVGVGAGMFGAGGLVALFGAAALIAALVLGLSTALAAWLSALIVGVVLLAVAGAAALMGKKQIEQATPPMPEQTVETVKDDVEHVKSRAKR